MSYILDALRRADAERAQGAVPDLNAQPFAPPVADDDVRSRTGSPWAWLGAGAAVVLAAWGAWKSMGPDAAAPRVEASAVPVPAVPATAPVPAPSPLPVTPTTPAVPDPAPPQPPPTAAAPSPAPVAAPPPVEKRPVAKTPPPPAPAPAPRIPKLAELPEELRASVPQLAIGGSVYSPQRAARMVIVNGQVFREGDALAAGLKLEQIRAKSAVFSIRGQSFELPY